MKDIGYIITRYKEITKEKYNKHSINNGEYPYRGWYEKVTDLIPKSDVKYVNHQLVKRFYSEEKKLDKKYHVYKGGLKKKDSKPLFSVVIQKSSDPFPITKTYEEVCFAVIEGGDVNYFQIK